MADGSLSEVEGTLKGDSLEFKALHKLTPAGLSKKVDAVRLKDGRMVKITEIWSDGQAIHFKGGLVAA